MDILFEPGTIIFLLVAIVYVLGRKYIESSERRTRPISDEEILAFIAVDRKCSEYDLFFQAAESWQVPSLRIEDDFKRYLTLGILPHYVRDFLRKYKSTHPINGNDRINPGGNLPASWSA